LYTDELWKMLQGVLGEANGEVSDAHIADDFCHLFPEQSRLCSVLNGHYITLRRTVPRDTHDQ